MAVVRIACTKREHMWHVVLECAVSMLHVLHSSGGGSWMRRRGSGSSPFLAVHAVNLHMVAVSQVLPHDSLELAVQHCRLGPTIASTPR